MSAQPALAEEYEALLQFLYMAPIGLAQTRIEGEILMINPLCAQLLMPLSRDGGLANLFTALETIAPDLRLRAGDFEPGHGRICDAVHLQIDSGLAGTRDPQVLSLTLLKLDRDRLMAVLDDVSLSVKRERELRRSQAWIHSIVIGITDYALLSLDQQGLVQEWNRGVHHVTGFDAASTTGQSYGIFFPASESLRHRLDERLEEAELSGWSLEEGWLRRADGGRYWGSTLIAPLGARDAEPPEERGYSLIVRDISDRREANEALRRSVFCDHLTGLANRRAFFDSAALSMQKCAESGHPVALALFDADHFKSINDGFGHSAGDAVLRHLAAGLGASFRSTDLVARFGGEEFVVLMPRTTIAEAEVLARRFCKGLAAKPVKVDGAAIHCTASGGVAAMASDVLGLDELIKRADAAMYAAKSRGRNRVETWSAIGPEPGGGRAPL